MEKFDEFNLKAFLPGVSKQFCPECGRAISQSENGRPRVFCSNECRKRWHWKHPKPEHWASARTVICPVCLKPFLSAKETYRPRRFCSRACANRGRSRSNKTQEENEA